MIIESLEAEVRPSCSGPDQPADISVIIPTCDRPELLAEAVESVLRQSLPPREILVLDNGTRSVDAACLPPSVTVVRLPPRVGPSRARNHGAAIAAGHYVAFLDDDDWWDPGFLQHARKAMGGDIRCVYGQKLSFRDGKLAPYKFAQTRQLQISDLLQKNPGTGGMNLLIDRNLFLLIGGFDEKLLLSEDRALAVEILRSGNRIEVVPEAITIVRHHASPRLREHHLRKLRFVRKYRGLYTPALLIGTVARILLAAFRSKACMIWSRLRALSNGSGGHRRAA
jgi:GT2 family glycosyltransferase